MLIINQQIRIPIDAIDFSAIRAQGSGGQHINKVSSAIHLRFNIYSGHLPAFYIEQLLANRDQRLNKDGIIIIKAQRFRSQEKNREDALARLQALLQQAGVRPTIRRPTKPTRSSQSKRMDKKSKHGQKKALRSTIHD